MSNPTLNNQPATAGDGVAGGGSNTSWALARAASGSTSGYTGTSTYLLGYGSANAGDSFNYFLYRALMAFDISSIPAGSVILSAVLDLYVTTVYSTGGGTTANNSAVLVAGTQASTSVLANSDFSQLGSTALANRLSYAAMTTGAYNSFTLNAAGLAQLQAALGGIAKFGCTTGYDFDNVAPSSGNYSGALANTADNASNKPRLTVVYSNVRTGTDTISFTDTAAGAFSRVRFGTDALSVTDSPGTYARSRAIKTVRAAGLNYAPGATISEGDTTITLGTNSLPSSGQVVVIDTHDSTNHYPQGLVTYTGKSGNNLTGCTWNRGSTLGAGWVFPSLYTRVCALDSENYFPMCTILDATDRPALMVSWSQKAAHAGKWGAIRAKITTDGGQSFGSEFSVLAAPVNTDWGIYGHSMLRCADGTILCAWYEQNLQGYNVYSYTMRGTYSGLSGAITWDTPVRIPNQYTQTGGESMNIGPGALFEYGGNIYLGVEGSTTLPFTGTDDFCKLLKTTDKGATTGNWSLISTIATLAQTGGYQNGEPAIRIAPSGRWICHLRVESSPPTRYQCYSDNGPAGPWTGHAQINSLVNTAVLYTAPEGYMLTQGGNSSFTVNTRTYISPDGTTWPTGQYRDEPIDGSYSYYVGSDLEGVEALGAYNFPNIANAYGYETGDQNAAQIYFRWFVGPPYVFDVITLTDTGTRGAISRSRSGADAISFTDTAVRGTANSRTGADTLAFTDTAARSSTPSNRTGADTVSLTDTATRGAVTRSRSGADVIALTDTATQSATLHGSSTTYALPATATFISARSQTAEFISARSQTATFIPGPA